MTLNQAQLAIASERASKLNSTYLETIEGVELWTDAAFAFFAAVVVGSQKKCQNPRIFAGSSLRPALLMLISCCAFFQLTEPPRPAGAVP